MKAPTLQDIAVQKSLALTEQEAMKVLIFIAGMEAERMIDDKYEGAGQPCGHQISAKPKWRKKYSGFPHLKQNRFL